MTDFRDEHNSCYYCQYWNWVDSLCVKDGRNFMIDRCVNFKAYI